MKEDRIKKHYGYITKEEELNTLLKLHREAWEQSQHATNENVKKECLDILVDTKKRMMELL